jgi:hypothetical protein
MVKSFSQASQDIFVNYMCANNGYFLDFGCYKAIDGSNTYMLENIGWSGLCFDIDDYSEEYKTNRTSKFIHGDVNKINLKNILIENKVPQIIDYISIDIDDSTEEFLDKFPFDEYSFRVITFEHNYYSQGKDLRDKSRNFFKNKGYKLFCSDVAVTYNSDNDYFEDWYINEAYIKKDKQSLIECDKTHHSKIVKLIENKLNPKEENLKECVILQYFVQDYTDEFILNKCVDSISVANLDIILISRSPVPKEIQKKVKYFIYESDEGLVTFEDIYNYEKVNLYTYKKYWTDNLEIGPFLFVVDDITYTFCKTIYDAHKIALAFGYDHSYYFTADFDIFESEINKMKTISKLVSIENKKGYFERSQDVMNAFFHYVDNKWYIDNFFLNMNSKDEFLKDLKEGGLYCHYDFLVQYQVDKNINDLIVKNVDYWGHPFVSEDRSDLSKKKEQDRYHKYNSYKGDIGIFYHKDAPHIFCFNFTKNTNRWAIYIEYDNGEMKKYIIESNYNWTMYPIEIKRNNFNIRCVNEENNKVKYNIRITDIDKYKRTFKIINK